MRVAIADDSGIFRDGLTRLLVNADVEVVHAARDGAELVAFVDHDPPDAVIVDVRMPPTLTEEGLDTAERIKALHPAVGVLVLSTYGETSYAMRLMRIPQQGVGYLLKDRVDDVGVLVRSLHTVIAGKPAVDPEIIARLLRREVARSAVTDLAEREREVLRLMAEGRSNAGVAEEMGISARTVETYAARVFTKLSIPDDSSGNRRVLAVLAWLRDGMPPP
ncbi:response regulator transcription factor [Pseudonocardia nematodicida]|uniref:Response regulator transcription factor n=1 Tax=Pseudonocardia nematodicida TaxID=1206997 RepID=A0ABV1KCZ0_9PSEU